MALGVTQQLPLDDRYTYSREYLMTRLAMLFGGRVAEELVFGQMTTGAGNDIEKATDLARKMVCEWGMSEELGPMTFGKREEQVFLGRDLAHQKDYSEHTAVEIDREVRRMIDESYQQAAQGHPVRSHHAAARARGAAAREGSRSTAREVAAMVRRIREGRPMPACTRRPQRGAARGRSRSSQGKAQGRRGRSADAWVDFAKTILA